MSEALEELKNKYLSICFKKNIQKSKSLKNLLKEIKKDAVFYKANNAFNKTVLDLFKEDLCNELGIYYKGKKELIKEKRDLIFLGDFKCDNVENCHIILMCDNVKIKNLKKKSRVYFLVDNAKIIKKSKESEIRFKTNTKIK